MNVLTQEPGTRRPEVAGALDSLDAALAAIEGTEFEDELTLFVKRRFWNAAAHRQRTGIDEMLALGAYAYHGRYSPAQLAELEPGTHIYIPVTATKCRAMQNWLTDILSGAVDRPFTIQPTPVPDIPPHLEDVAVERLMAALQQGEVSPDNLAEMANKARSLALEMVAQNTKQACDGMADKINDQMLEGGWRDAFDELVVDMSHMPAAVMTGPHVETVERVRWMNGVPTMVEDRIFTFRRVSPFDAFPAPGATTPQGGAFFIVRKQLGPDDLEAAKYLPNYRPEVIEQLIAAYPNGNTLWPGYDGMRQARDEFELRDNSASSRPAPMQEWTVLHYYGKLPVRLAREYGIWIAPHKGWQDVVEVELEICAGYVLRGVENPYPAHRRPVYMVGFQRRAGTCWFESLPYVLRDVQRGANATMRALVKNMALSAGPVVEADMDRILNERDLDTVVPYRIYKVTSDPMQATPSPALRFNQMTSTALHLIRVYSEFSNMADEVSGIPAYVAGNPDVAGAGRTLGGLSMLMGNAAKGIKRVIGLTDNRLIQPVVEMMYMINMLYLDDDSVKADAQVVARGASGLLAKELSQSRAIDLLNVILQPAVQQQGIIPPAATQTLLRDVASSMGYDPSLIGDQAIQQQLMTAMQTAGIDIGGLGGAQSVSQMQPAVQRMSGLDGRSQPPADPSAMEIINP